MSITTDIVATARRRVRGGVRAVRCENRFVARYVFNAGPAARYRQQPSRLNAGAARALTDLRRDGVALSTVDEVLGGRDKFDAASQYTQELRAARSTAVDPAKPFLIELLGSEPELAPGNPLLELALDPQIRGVAEAYSQLKLRVQDVNVWINLPTGGGPMQSQRWHRDLPEDHDIVKCFVYLSDVPQGAGPLQYVSGTNTPEGRKLKFATEFDGVGYRLADDDVSGVFRPDRIVTARGDAGTVAFADTRGIHRGGFAIDSERVVVQITYASNASVRPRNLRAAAGIDPSSLPDVRLGN